MHSSHDRPSKPENQCAIFLPLVLGVKETTLSASPSFSLRLLSKLRSGVGVGGIPRNVLCELDLCIAWGNVMPLGREGGVLGLGLSRERKLSEGFGVR